MRKVANHALAEAFARSKSEKARELAELAKTVERERGFMRNHDTVAAQKFYAARDRMQKILSGRPL